jgi:hypothetical protein
MFPIVFAAISGRSMKMIARYLAEKGAKISVRTDSHIIFDRESTRKMCKPHMLNFVTDLRNAHG